MPAMPQHADEQPFSSERVWDQFLNDTEERIVSSAPKEPSAKARLSTGEALGHEPGTLARSRAGAPGSEGALSPKQRLRETWKANRLRDGVPQGGDVRMGLLMVAACAIIVLFLVTPIVLRRLHGG